MREISIFTEKEHYAPGESADGHILIRTDKEFNCNRIVLQAQGKEYTHYQAGKAHVSETHIVLNEETEVYHGGVVYPGDTKFDFEFGLPENIPPVHSGFHGTIQYSIQAVVEVDRSIDPKSKIDLNVTSQAPLYIQEQELASKPIRREEKHLLVEVPTDILRPKRGFQVRILVRERSRVKGIRIEVHRQEDVLCRGHHLESRIVITQKPIPITFSDFDRWIDETIEFDWSAVTPFAAKLIKTSLVLKVVMEVGLAIDPSVEIPLQVSGAKAQEGVPSDSIDIGPEW